MGADDRVTDPNVAEPVEMTLIEPGYPTPDRIAELEAQVAALEARLAPPPAPQAPPPVPDYMTVAEMIGWRRTLLDPVLCWLTFKPYEPLSVRERAFALATVLAGIAVVTGPVLWVIR